MIALGPILSSLRRNKVGVALIALQMALTLAVLCNALFIIQQQIRLSRTPSGVRDEGSVFVIRNQWIGKSTDRAARVQADLAALRALPQIADATVSGMHPLGGGDWGMGITLHPHHPGSGTGAAAYFVDDHAIRTLGLRLIAGRSFRPEEIVPLDEVHGYAHSLAGVIVTKALARKLAPGGNILGRVAWIVPGPTRAPVIGVIASLQPSPRIESNQAAGHSMLLPYLDADAICDYLLRAKPGQLEAAMTAARTALLKISRQRILLDVKSLADWRLASYRSARGVALIMLVISAILLAVTALGIVGLTNYWVSQRTRQIGIRRALGATRGGIVRYFLAENLLITVTGCILGVLLALLANVWLLRNLALTRLPASYVVVGAIAVLILGQLAVLWPALRAAWVPPAVATRSV